MNLFTRLLAGIALLSSTIVLASGQANAQRQGGGNNAPGTLLVFDYVASVNGKTPTWSGDYTMAAPTPMFGSLITNLSFSIRGKNLNLSDNTRLFINLSTFDITSGTQFGTDASRWHCMSAMQVTGKLGIVKGYNDFVDESTSTIVRKFDRLTITDANGTVLATAH